MSLELRISELTEAVQKLTAILQSQQITPAADTPTPAPAPARAARGSAKKEEKQTPAADTGTPTTVRATIALGAVNDGKTESLKLQAGDPVGTLYFHVAAHKTVAAVQPGQVVPNMAGLVEIDGDAYTALKAQYGQALTGASGNAPAATPSPAPATAAAANASSSAGAQSPQASGTDTGVKVTEVCKALHARDGNDGLKKVLDHFKAARVGELVAKSDMHAAVIAHVEALLNPQPAAGPDLF